MTTRRKLLVLGAFIALIVLALLLMLKPRGRGPGSLASFPASQQRDGLAGPDAADARTSVTPTIPVETADPDRSPSVLSGTLDVRDRNGQHVQSRHGGIVWSISRDGVEREATSWVRDDAWTLEAAPEEILSPLRVTWSDSTWGMSTEVEPLSIAASDAQGLVVHATLRPGIRLDVLASESSSHLPDVRIIVAGAANGPYRETSTPPLVFRSNPALALPRQDSPLYLPPVFGIRPAWVGAEGRAWRRIAFVGDEGDMSVLLHPGADVDVQIIGLKPDQQDARLILYVEQEVAQGGEPLADRSLRAAQEVRFDGLPVGPVTLAVVASGGTLGLGPLLAMSERALGPGRNERWAIDCSSSRDTAGFGSVRVTRDRRNSDMGASVAVLEGDIDAPHLQFDFAASGPTATETHVFTGVPPGSYVVSLMPEGLARAIDVQPGSTTDVEFVVGATIEVELTVVDGDTDKVLTSPTVSYHPAASRHASAWKTIRESQSFGGPSNDPVTRFRCAPGPVEISVKHSGYAPLLTSITVGEQDTEHVLRVQRLSGGSFPIQIQSVQGSQPVPLPPRLWLGTKVEGLSVPDAVVTNIRLDFKQIASLQNLDSPGATYFVSALGRYRVTFPPTAGLLELPPITVDVASAEGCTVPVTAVWH